MDGNELGHFSLLEKIGEGGMGRVFKARDRRLGRFVAIKLVSEARSTEPSSRARFIQEAKAASALNHPNIVTIHEIGEQNGEMFIVMELVEGKALSELIPRKGMRLTEAMRIAAQVAGALTAAHAAGIVHRDVKPGNIMVDALGRVKVLDFGLAKLSAGVPAAEVDASGATHTFTGDGAISKEGAIAGSAPYMSPEQVEGKRVDVRSDIFSFGAVLYEMITGHRAFQGESRISTLAAIVEKNPPAPSEVCHGCPPELDRLIARCLRKGVNRRSQSMADVKLLLEELGEEAEYERTSRPATVVRTGRRLPVLLAPAVALAIIAAAALGWNYFNRHGAQIKHSEMTPPAISANWDGKAPKSTGYVTDIVNVVDPESKLWLEQYLRGLEQRHGAQTGILVIDTLHDQPIDAFALTVFKSWGVGRRDKNDGLLLVLATQDHRSRLTVGSGLDYLFTSELCQRILEGMKPSLRKGQYGQALRDACLEIGSIFNGKSLH